MVEIVIKVTDCRQCPYCQVERTKGAGYAFDYSCSKYPKWNNVIATYVEYESEFPKEIPMWCPFRKENISETVD